MHKAFTTSVAVFPNGTLLSARDDGRIQLWRHGERINEMNQGDPKYPSPVTCVAVLGNFIGTGGSGVIKLWNDQGSGGGWGHGQGFVFSLVPYKDFNQVPMKFSVKQPQYSIYRSSSHAATFGTGHDIYSGTSGRRRYSSPNIYSIRCQWRRAIKPTRTHGRIAARWAISTNAIFVQCLRR